MAGTDIFTESNIPGNEIPGTSIASNAALDIMSGGGHSALKMFGVSPCGGKKKSSKPGFYSGKGGRISQKGDRLLAAYDYLYPRTLELVGKTAAGYGDLYRKEIDKTRADELAGFEKYGPGYVAALDAADPLRKKTKDIIMANLDEGLDPSMVREVQQGSRAAYGSRGLAESPASAVDELLNLGSAGRNLESRNLAEAQRFLASTDPFLAYAGRPATPQGANVQSPNYSSYTDDLFTYDVNSDIMRNNNQQAAKNRTASYINAGISAAGSIAGGAASFI